MTDKEINNARQKYLNTSGQHKELLELKKEAILLLQNPKVKRFLEIQEYLELDDLNEDKIIMQSFRNIAFKTSDSNKIMVYIGTYIYDKDEILTYEYSMAASYNKYVDLETQESYIINMNKVEEFEDEHLVIYIPNRFLIPEIYMKNYMKLKRYFFRELIKNPQPVVVKKLQDREIINKIVK